MSLLTAMKKFVTEFNAESGFTTTFGTLDNEGIPEDAIKGPFPGVYLEQGPTTREYGSRLPDAPTANNSDAFLLHVFNADDVSSGETMKNEAARREQLIVDWIETETGLRTWESDGADGFGLVPVTTLWYILPHASVAAFRTQLRFFAYGK